MLLCVYMVTVWRITVVLKESYKMKGFFELLGFIYWLSHQFMGIGRLFQFCASVSSFAK